MRRDACASVDSSVMVAGMLLGFARGLCALICRPSRNEMHVHEAKKYILQLHRNNNRYVICSPVDIKYSAFSWGG